MGDHYVPRFYLKGFVENPQSEAIWVFCKNGGKYHTNIQNVAQENRFYSREVETYLANNVEYPAKPVLQKIRDRQLITVTEKQTFARYMMALMKRVPDHQAQIEEKAPDAIEAFLSKLESSLDESEKLNPSRIDTIERRRREIKEFRQSPDKQKAIGHDAWLTNIAPERTPQVLEAISLMTWRFWVIEDDEYFITCDNPVFFFRGIGIGRPESEISFPIARNIALCANWRDDLLDHYAVAKKPVVREINRRTAKNKTSCLYSPYPDDWVLKYALKKNFWLNRIV